jgi:stearoyl-CoA desaturase (delta-9 desaturase)
VTERERTTQYGAALGGATMTQQAAVATAPTVLSPPETNAVDAASVSLPPKTIAPVGVPARSLSQWFNAVGVVMIHVGTVFAFVRGADRGLVGLAAAFYVVRMFAVTGVYHRYFAHRAYKTSRLMQFLLALLGTSATQKGPLWWASSHRLHHKYSDTPRDLHSPKQRGFWYAHMGWWLGRDHEATDWKQIKDFAQYPELRFLERWHVLGVALCMALATALRGWDGFLWGYVVSTCALLHGTFTINSLSHVFGSQRYVTGDTSRNNFALALITMGEGWHNNHHHYMNSANQGFFWWEIDLTYYILKALEAVGLIWDVKRAPAFAVHPEQRASLGSGV